LGFVVEKNIIEIVKTRQIKENENKKAHRRGCICGIKKYLTDNLGLTSLGYFFN
jgi:hypothetical protein